MSPEQQPTPEPEQHHDAWLCAVCALAGFQSGAAVTQVAGTLVCAEHAWQVARQYPALNAMAQRLGIVPRKRPR
jgi:hypothetical protein